jgi:hypothetical protein
VSSVLRFVEFCSLRPEVLCALLGTSRAPGSFWSVGLAAAAANTKKAVALCHGGCWARVLFGSSHSVGLDTQNTQAGSVGET